MSENGNSKRKPTTYSELYPGRFLHADHLKGKHVTLTIADVDIEELVGEKGKEVKAVIAFEKTPLLYVLPKLNGQCLKAMWGANVRDWVGKRVVLFPTADIFPMKKGEACIRIHGSPDIASDVEVRIAMPQRKPRTLVMKATGKGACVPPSRDEAEADSPPPEDEDELGGRQ